MKKIQIKAECLNVQVNQNGSNASFVVKSDKQPAQPAQPGQPQRLNVRRAIQFNFDDDTAKQFEPGKEYSITVEGTK